MSGGGDMTLRVSDPVLIWLVSFGVSSTGPFGIIIAIALELMHYVRSGNPCKTHDVI